MKQKLEAYCESLVRDFQKISPERKKLLSGISQYIVLKQEKNKPVNLLYICTHNSRRSHFGQVWAHVAAKYFGIDNVFTFSGGTEVTAFNANAISALTRAGFDVKATENITNAVYNVAFDDNESPVVCFSKTFNDPVNPKSDFAAIMTCSDAEENCPFIPGAEVRFAATYDDPKAFDNTLLQDEKYDERCRQIALETFYVFSNVMQA